MSWDEFEPRKPAKAETREELAAGPNASAPSRGPFTVLGVWLSGIGLGAAATWAAVTLLPGETEPPAVAGDVRLRFVSREFPTVRDEEPAAAPVATRMIVMSASVKNESDRPLSIDYLRCLSAPPEAAIKESPYRLVPVSDDVATWGLLQRAVGRLAEATESAGGVLLTSRSAEVAAEEMASGPREVPPGRVRHLVFAGLVESRRFEAWYALASKSRRPDFEPELAPKIKTVQPAGTPPTEIVAEAFAGDPLVPAFRTRLHGRNAYREEPWPAGEDSF